MKVNVIKAKDKYAQSCGSLDWYDQISGMSSRDVEIEMEHVCEQVTSEMLEMLTDAVNEYKAGERVSDGWYKAVEQLIKEATEI